MGGWNRALQGAAQPTTQAGLRRSAPRPKLGREGQHTSAWTQVEAVGALQAHRDRYGRWPAYEHWMASDPTGQRPSTRTVTRLFGSWSAGLRAAGDPRPRGAQGAARVVVLAALADGQARTAREIAHATGLKITTAQSTLVDLAALGQLVKAPRGYRKPHQHERPSGSNRADSYAKR